jgi:hypothetical protein
MWPLYVGLGVAVGLWALVWAIGRSFAAGIAAMANPQLTTMEFGELPDWVGQKLAGLREEFLALGFRELTTYTRNSPRLNYTCALLAPDCVSVASIWVARSHGVTLWVVTPLRDWSAFKNDLDALPRYGLMTRFPDGRFVETTHVEILARGHVVGKSEFLIVPRTMALAEVRALHATAVQDFAAREAVEPIQITDAKQFLDLTRAMILRLANKFRKLTS